MPAPIARRKTADNKTVLLWADGLVTLALGYRVRGVGVARDSWGQDMDLRAGWAVMGEVCLFTMDELPKAVKAVRKLFRTWNWAGNAPTPGYVRHVMAKAVS
jgi:hypothetical protein